MVIFSDPRCLDYGRPGHPERSERIAATRSFLQEKHPDWQWREPQPASEAALLRVHTAKHLARLELPTDFDADTVSFPGIGEHARRAAGGAIAVMQGALAGEKCFSLFRPPGHHASAERAMGFCYLNSITIAAQEALAQGVERVAIWDFDAHHGNGTEDLVAGNQRIDFASVHQLPGWPGSGAASFGNVRNYPVPPVSPRGKHLEVLQQSLAALLDLQPGLLLVSAGFDAYVGDPITEMTLLEEDFAELGRWLGNLSIPTACILEGGYSEALPRLIDAFLTNWDNS